MWKIQIILKILFICSKDTGKERDISLKHKNITVIIGRIQNDLIKSIFNSLFLEHQKICFKR